MQRMQIQITPLFFCASMVLACSGHAQGVVVDASGIVAVRHIIPPENPTAWIGTDYDVGGIDGNGNIMGMMNSARGHHRYSGCHCEDPVVWKRSDHYAGKVVYGGYPYFTPITVFHLPLDFLADFEGEALTDRIRQKWADQGVPLADDAELNPYGTGWEIVEPDRPCRNTGEACHQLEFQIFKRDTYLKVDDNSPAYVPHGIHLGFNRPTQHTHMVNVNEAGIVVGVMNADNGDTFSYHIDEDKLYNHSGGMGMFANNNGVVLSSFSDYSEMPKPFVAHRDLISDKNPRGIIQFLSPDVLRTRGINDEGIIVGGHDGDAYRIIPTGQTTNGYPTYDELDIGSARMESLSDGDAIAIAISNSDPPIAVGNINAPPITGTIWNAENGHLITTLGEYSRPFGITDNGMVAYGSIKALRIGAPLVEEAALWYTQDGTWTDVQEVYLDDLLLELQEAEVEGANLVESFSGNVGNCCWVAGINNRGQLLVQGIPAVASTEGMDPRSGTAVFLLDTMALPLLGGLPGDVNNDGEVNNLDITSFIAALAAEDAAAFLAEVPAGNYANADLDGSGSPNNLDITPFINALTAEASAVAVPEPATLVLLLAVGTAALRRRQ